ncbi:peptidase S9 [Pseudoxanthomonas dokdonensis]|uniref:Peptidase S9 n=1 Tax=Pseudoxanthomonas dokdonensis TaxID=344882 RepID=A0A0R0D1T3_9GAMM|nr:S9 family peptidase [Pseudoxanthomonas dokdonensis]KRG71940.1 peptidase S9 [Pseudoxanthomonas dokdonensis]
MRHVLPALLLPLTLLAAVPSLAQDTTPLTIEQVMADPDWIGPPVEDAWWAWDGQQVQYEIKRDASLVRDTYRQPVGGGAPTLVDAAQRSQLDASHPVYDHDRQRMLFVRNGDVFLRDLRSGSLTQLSRSNETEAEPRFSSNGGAIWRVDNQWYQWSQGSGVSEASDLKAEKDPADADKPDGLRAQQLRMLSTLEKDKSLREAAKQQAEAWRKADPTRAPLPAYLGDKVEIVDSSLSPDGRHLLVVTQEKDADAGKAGKMPQYVTESGYEEFKEVRTRVGHNAPVAQSLWLVDVASGTVRALDFSSLPGIDQDPLAKLRKQAGQEALKGNRPVRIENDSTGQAMIWSDDGQQVAVQIHSIDNKDRWIASVDFDKARLQPRHRLTDAAWINWGFNEFGWLPDNRTLWLLSEQDGHSHFYTQQGSGKARQHTSGNWEVSAPDISSDGRSAYFLCNRERPADYEVCQLDLGSDQVREVTALDGVESFSLSPDGRQLLVRHSRAYLPTQISVVGIDGSGARQLTDTRTAAFKSRDWIQPQIVQVPSSHGAGHVWAKYYGPAQLQPGKQYPIVMFVHGAGYLQNVHMRYPAYFREQMFHNLLVQKGYIVLDMDYRGSEGYGRDWRTAIYRNMGHPELEDYLDGLDWLVANKQGDRDHAGIYGGSYGGFMTFMALFREPGVFKAGAALRPVTDWTQYNHEYTSNILNTPDIDPEAYRVSSPIEYAGGLQDHLLIAHGMVDDNVFFKDSVVLTQKLIELHKDNWEIAPYPLEPHGFTRADSWLDEYKRILKLFESNLK